MSSNGREYKQNFFLGDRRHLKIGNLSNLADFFNVKVLKGRLH